MEAQVDTIHGAIKKYYLNGWSKVVGSRASGLLNAKGGEDISKIHVKGSVGGSGLEKDSI
uniref:Uncharacterized protein n=1 Tax=Nelumbo nucifera TaxID=4432 RepID=A0A822ZQD0_NELNU|nr:TPA_asm: hypothetical protein HUJ06_003366 [Nelumbo nucifera]